MSIDFNVVVPAAKAGDKAARDQLMAAFYAWSVTQARAVVRDSEMAKDIAVDFWTWLFTGGGLDVFDPAKGTFYSWMGVCIKNRAKNVLARSRPDVVYYSEVQDPDGWSPSPESGVIAFNNAEHIMSQLRGQVQKDVLVMLAQGYTAEDIAQELNLSPKRAQNIIGEIRGLIRGQLSD